MFIMFFILVYRVGLFSVHFLIATGYKDYCTEADENVISPAGKWSKNKIIEQIQILVRCSRWITAHTEGNINVSIKFHEFPSNSCQGMSLKPSNVKPDPGAQRKVRGAPESLGFILWEPGKISRQFIQMLRFF